ncbi:MAG: hypothetical protein VX246_13820 [Myxococcota bacterium]|nr:hypothetical protein [Myxococcota bacterium]
MPQIGRTLQRVITASTVLLFIAAASHADSTPENITRAKQIKGDIRTALLPQLTVGKSDYSGRDFKKSTLFQMDTQLTEDSDFLFRVQAKQKRFVYFEFRF